MPKRFFLLFLPIALLISILAGFPYLAIRQALRAEANDPQIQMAEDLADVLLKGQSAADMKASGSLADMEQTLSPFIIIYDEMGKSLFSTIQLNGSTPTPPSDVLNAAKNPGDHRLTWAPKPNIHIAAVIVHFGGSHPGFVLAGRSLREVEKRETTLGEEFLLTWLIALIVAATSCFIAAKKNHYEIVLS